MPDAAISAGDAILRDNKLGFSESRLVVRAALAVFLAMDCRLILVV